MGYWEQIKVSNEAELERRKSGSFLRRIDWLGLAAIPVAVLFYLGIGAEVLRLLHLI